MAIFTVYEYSSLLIRSTPHEDNLPWLLPSQADALAGLEATLPVGALSVGRKSVRFGNYCGLIRAGQDVFEVLPKIHRDSPRANRSLLVEMLAGCAGLPVFELPSASLALQNHSLLEFFIKHFCGLLMQQLRQGMIRNYVDIQENSPRVRGRILWRQQVAYNLFHQERSYCEYDELSEDNAHNRVIKATLFCLLRWTRQLGDVQRRLSYLIDQFEAVSDLKLTARDARALPKNRLLARYEPLLKWCEWFLSGESPDLRGGQEDGAALLFDMNRLFQDYVFQRLHRLCLRDRRFQHLQVTAERPVKTLLERCSGERKNLFQLRPDIVVCATGSAVPVLIIDTKWKLLSAQSEDEKHGVKQADAYQMLAYARVYGCEQIALMYPSHAGIRGTAMPEFRFRDREDSKARLAVASVDLDCRPGQLSNMVNAQLERFLVRLPAQEA